MKTMRTISAAALLALLPSEVSDPAPESTHGVRHARVLPFDWSRSTDPMLAAAHLEDLAPYRAVEGPGEWPGRWRYERGARICDGYLTSDATEEFCAASPPASWREFEFQGETFFAHRLAQKN